MIKRLVILIAVAGAVLPSVCAAEPASTSLVSDDAARLEMARMLRADQRMEEAVKEYQRVLAENPQRSDVRIELAEIQLALEEVSAASETLQGMAPEEWTVRGKTVAANIAILRKQFGEAAQILAGLVESDPDNDSLRFQWAEVLSWGGNQSAAATEYGRLVARRPLDVQLRRRYARALGWAGRPAEAAAQWKISLEGASE